ncbi:hypothetical protein BTVI_62499 [Pitangus sulphuratus]|nr:hypothetical protein BTVI_62499 [Pitangus sulphuratus]
MVRQAVPLQPMEVQSGAEIHLQILEDPMPKQLDAQRNLCPHGKPALEQAPGSICGPMERGAHTEAGLLAGLVTLWGATLEQPIPDGLYPTGRIYAGAICEELQPVGSTGFFTVGEVHGGLPPMGGTPRWSREAYEESFLLRRKEKQRLHVMNWSQPPFPVPLHHWGEEGEKSGVKLSLGRRSRRGGGFRF